MPNLSYRTKRINFAGVKAYTVVPDTRPYIVRLISFIILWPYRRYQYHRIKKQVLLAAEITKQSIIDTARVARELLEQISIHINQDEPDCPCHFFDWTDENLEREHHSLCSTFAFTGS